MAITFDTPEIHIKKFPSGYDVDHRSGARQWYAGCVEDDRMVSCWSWQEMFDLYTHI